jgi:hypothetical protein
MRLSWIYPAVGFFDSLSGTCVRVSTFDEIVEAINSNTNDTVNVIQFCPFSI